MPELLDLIRIFPVVSTIVPQMGLGDVLNLSRVNSHYRAVLHGFALPASSSSSCFSPQQVRPDIHIGDHQTAYWKAIKKSGQLLCSEPFHRKGSTPRLCTYCSMPVCEACIVRQKESFRKTTSAYKTRTRPFCIDCWVSGNPHDGRRPSAPRRITPYDFTPAPGDYCTCTAKDGWICSKCRETQVAGGKEPISTCIGEGCTRSPGSGNDRRRICLWCHLPISARPSMDQWREGYGERHALSEFSHSGDLRSEDTDAEEEVVPVELTP
ncbi:hypothetical protein FQN53_001886 [Emmonsiellopsis sp. PD_33]|nr:hypothetical protein FQN53_001886 [Emmonsiellopsis sp. PD_33]